MANLNSQQMQEYLKQVSELEVSVYKQTQIKNKANEELVYKDVSMKYPTMPKKVDERLNAPVRPEERFGCAMYPMFFFGGVGVAAGIGANLLYEGSGAAILVIGIILLCVGAALKFAGKKAADDEYDAALSIYREKREILAAEYKKEMAEWQIKQKEAEKEHSKKTSIAKGNFEKAKQAVLLLEKPLADTEEMLADLYALDIVFPKYRNIVAMCTIYEYFASGRCTELSGPDGAYNLYESELRQNLIINQLDAINANLEQIKQNQYVLYQGIAATNQIMGEMAHDVKSIVNATKDIAVSSRISAYCAEVTAKNTEALKAIEILRG